MMNQTPTAIERGYVIDVDHFNGSAITIVNHGKVAFTREHSPHQDRPLTVEEYLAHPTAHEGRNVAILSEEAFDAFLANYHQERYFDAPPEVITEEQYDDYFGAMPLLKQGHRDGMSYFLMSEPLTGTIVRMCAAYEDGYYTKHVDYRKPATWITPDHLKMIGAEVTQ